MENNSLILIVDDTIQNLQVLGSMLKDQGYNIAAVTSGEEALDFIDNKKPDLILLDIMMPGLDGFEVCEQLQEGQATKKIPIIFISALNEIEDKVKGFEVGGVDFITKPFQKEEVLARVETHLELKKNREKIKKYSNNLEKRNMELEKLQDKLNEQLKKGKKLHRQFLPDKLPKDKQIATEVYYQLTQQIGGDFYNFIEFDEQLIGYIVDITGHGLDGALLNIFVRESISSFLQNQTELKKVTPEEILEFIYKKYEQENFSDDYFICVGLFILDKASMTLVYSNAGLQFSPIVIKDNKIIELVNKGLPISTAIDLELYDFDEAIVKLEPGDKFLIMTDGLAEEVREGSRYGIDRINKLVEENITLPIGGIINKIQRSFNHFIDSTPCTDDITLLGLEYRLEAITKHIIEVPSNLAELEVIKEQVKEVLDPECSNCDKLIMAFHEMIVNAIRHGNSEENDKVVTVTIEVTEQYVILIVKDEGKGFDWNSTLLEEDIYDNESDSGRGLKIAELACDSIYYNTDGNEVFLIKLRSD